LETPLACSKAGFIEKPNRSVKLSDWYKLDSEAVLEELDSSLEHGLDSTEAAQRLDTYGLNELIEQDTKSPWRILLEQFSETMVVILIIAAIISAVLGEFKDATAIIVIVILNGLLGFRQEYKAEQAMAALKKLAVPTVRVRRDGRVVEVNAQTLVPGDIVLLEAGNVVPADCRVVESANIRTQEAALTGESEPVEKRAGYVAAEDIPLADRKNMIYMGTVVTYGRGQAIVAETGMRTELGGIAELMQSASGEQTPLQRRLDQLGKGLALAAGALVAIVFLMGLLRGEDIKELFLTSISIAVAAVPEGLPAVVTIALALGARRMLKREALIRKLPAVEALGSVTVICSDKTGTLTENRMTVTVLDVAENRIDLSEEEVHLPMRDRNVLCVGVEPDEKQQDALRRAPALTLMLVGGALCNDALLECDDESRNTFHIVGDPTEGALLVAAARMGLIKESLEDTLPRVAEVPFDSDRKRMTTVHEWPETQAELPEFARAIWDWEGWAGLGRLNYIAVTKGSVDGLLDICDRVWVEDLPEALDANFRQRIENANARLAGEGMRVLGLAVRALDVLPEESEEQDADQTPDLERDAERDLIFVGLVGMIDPARPEVKAAVETCRTAGIRPVMITGDHPLTAGYIARELGIISDGGALTINDLNGARPEGDQVLTGSELERMSADDLESVVERVSVYARVSPEHKLRIVEALQKGGQIAAMTGDGVNDAPALKKADIGVAMGITGTDVSKEASSMVLLDDNFATIVAAVREGRVIYDNIRKFIQYTLTSNTGEIWIMLLAPFLGMPLPLLPIQILWINLVTDGLPGLALGVEQAESNTMRRPPYPPNENVFARGLARNILWIGLLMGLIALGVGFSYWQMENPMWQTMIFTTITLSEMGYVMAIRSNRDSLFSVGPFSNRALVGAVALTTILQLMVIYIPFLQGVFGTMALPMRELLICFGLSTSLFVAVEIQKWFSRRRSTMEPTRQI
jgi:Ca2+-transporting ATPase